MSRYRQASRATLSLDAPVGDDDSNRIAEVVADPNAASPFDQIAHETDRDLVRQVLFTLTERERAILSLRFQFSDHSEKTLEQIGKEFGLTRERIRQIQEQVLRKRALRSRAENAVIRNYW